MQKIQSRPYFPHLDGLRFFAFLIVFISHAVLFIWDGKLFLAQGDLGVSFFFVLSGFLITFLLYFEKESARGYIKLTHLYARRILRIWPVYFMVLILSILLSQINFTHLPFEIGFNPASFPWFFGFITNFYLIAPGGLSVALAVLWSISVEEQFYLVWPLIVSYSKKKYMPYILLGLIIFGTVFRYINFNKYAVVSYSTFSVVSDLAVGALFGFFAFHRKNFSERMGLFFTKKRVRFLYLLIIGCLYIKMFPHGFITESLTPLYVALLPVIFSFLFACIIMEQNYSAHSFFKASTHPYITYLGKISYGLYAYHSIVIALVFSVLRMYAISSPALITILSFVGTIGIAHLSYRFIEKKIIALKQHVL